ncbi:hypothetical protein FACS189464_3490 [Bacteroidia bacterium]|nr:hypothetical protein FACS189464_3490 [Bacteroidia bacterium]
MKRVSLVIIAAVLLSACATSPETAFKQFGLSFTCPAGWTVGETEDYGNGCYLSVEKNGFNSSGLVTVTKVDEEYDELTDFLSVYREGLEESPAFSQLQFGKATTVRYGSYQGIAISYSAKALTVAHKGRIVAFSVNGKSVCIIEQGADEDKDKNKAGFKTIEDSFTVGEQLEEDTPLNDNEDE